MDVFDFVTFDNFGNIDKLTHAFREKVKPVTIFVSVELVVGLIANCLIIYVFAVRYKRCAYRCFVFFLAMIDVVSCFTSMAGEIYAQMFWFDFKYPGLCQAKSFFNIFTVSADVLCLLAIALDRYKATCLPTSTQMSHQLALFFCGGIFGSACVIAVPAVFVGTLHDFAYEHDEEAFNVRVCGHKNSDEASTYVIILLFIIFLSLIVLLLSYVLIIKRLLQKETKPSESAETVQTEQKTPLLYKWNECQTEKPLTRQQTIMMSLVTMIFISTILTYLALEIVIAKKHQTFSLIETAIYSLCLRLYFINHVINPLIFGFFDPNLRYLLRCRSRQTRGETALLTETRTRGNV